jgi:hypothetical protein
VGEGWGTRVRRRLRDDGTGAGEPRVPRARLGMQAARRRLRWAVSSKVTCHEAHGLMGNHYFSLATSQSSSSPTGVSGWTAAHVWLLFWFALFQFLNDRRAACSFALFSFCFFFVCSFSFVFFLFLYIFLCFFFFIFTCDQNLKSEVFSIIEHLYIMHVFQNLKFLPDEHFYI